jgi:hypothetical protein
MLVPEIAFTVPICRPAAGAAGACANAPAIDKGNDKVIATVRHAPSKEGRNIPQDLLIVSVLNIYMSAGLEHGRFTLDAEVAGLLWYGDEPETQKFPLETMLCKQAKTMR